MMRHLKAIGFASNQPAAALFLWLCGGIQDRPVPKSASKAYAENLLRGNTAHKNKGNDSGQDGGNRISPHFKQSLQAGLLLAEYNQGEYRQQPRSGS